ncbi:hypothetical protein ACLB2K_054866 [Fragaria x ananassa]
MVKWVIELGEFDLHFKPRTTIKGQAAVDFIVEFIPLDPGNPDPEALPREAIWELHVDGSSNNKFSGAGIIITDPVGNSYEYALRFEFKGSNNVAEYEALIAGIQLCRELGTLHIHIFSDSQLAVNQVAGDFKANQSNLGSYKSLANSQHFASQLVLVNQGEVVG